MRAAGFAYEGIGRGVDRCAPRDPRPDGSLSAGADPRRRGGDAAAAADLDRPKPVVPLVDRPFIAFMLEWLRGHGVDDVVISCGFMASGVRNVLGDGSAYGMRLRYVEEPSRSAPAARSSSPRTLLDERFLMLNGDVLTDIDLTAQLAQHERTGARATLALVPVEDPSAYGLVRRNADGERARVPREAEPRPDRHEPHQRRRLRAAARRARRRARPAQHVSIEREVFPTLVGDGLYGYEAAGYWLDIGTPERYLQATYDILDGAVRTTVTDAYDAAHLAVAEGAEIAGRVVGPALVGAGARVAEGALVTGRTRARPRRRGRRGRARRRLGRARRRRRSARTHS